MGKKPMTVDDHAKRRISLVADKYIKSSTGPKRGSIDEIDTRARQQLLLGPEGMAEVDAAEQRQVDGEDEEPEEQQERSPGIHLGVPRATSAKDDKVVFNNPLNPTATLARLEHLRPEQMVVIENEAVRNVSADYVAFYYQAAIDKGSEHGKLRVIERTNPLTRTMEKLAECEGVSEPLSQPRMTALEAENQTLGPRSPRTGTPRGPAKRVLTPRSGEKPLPGDEKVTSAAALSNEDAMAAWRKYSTDT